MNDGVIHIIIVSKDPLTPWSRYTPDKPLRIVGANSYPAAARKAHAMLNGVLSGYRLVEKVLPAQIVDEGPTVPSVARWYVRERGEA